MPLSPLPIMEESWSSSSQFPSWASTSTTPETPTPTDGSSDCSSTAPRHDPGASPLPDSSPSPNDPTQSPTLTSFNPPPTTADSSTEKSATPLTTKHGKSLNVTALAIGVTGAVLLLIVCGVIAFQLWKRKQKNKVPPSAEFRDVAFVRHPRNYREVTSATSSMSIRKDGISFAASPLRPNEV